MTMKTPFLLSRFLPVGLLVLWVPTAGAWPFKSKKDHGAPKSSSTKDSSRAGVKAAGAPKYLNCNKKTIEAMMELNRISQERVLGKGGKGNEAFAETFASDRLVTTPEIERQLEEIFPKGHPLGKPKGLYVQPWGNAHVMRVAFEAPTGQKREIILRSTPGEEFGRVKAIALEFDVQRGQGQGESGELCHPEIMLLTVKHLNPRPITPTPTVRRMVSDQDLATGSVIAGIETVKDGELLTTSKRVTFDAIGASEGPVERYVTSSSTYTLKETPLPATTASLKTESKYNTTEVGASSLNSSGASLDTKVTDAVKTQVSGGYAMTEGKLSGLQTGVGSELQLSEKAKLSVTGARTETVGAATSDDAIGAGLALGNVQISGELGAAKDVEGVGDANRRGVATKLQVSPTTAIDVGLAETQTTKVKNTNTVVSAGVSHTLPEGGAVAFSGSRDSDADSFGANLSFTLPWPGERSSTKPAVTPPKAPTLTHKRKEIIKDPKSGEWVYVVRFYDERGEKRGEVSTGQKAPDPESLVREVTPPQSKIP
jgi:hypothetical protein